MYYDVLTLGETMLRFTPPHGQRLEQAHSFDVTVGGSESNTAIGIARLGLRVCWLSRLTDNPLGRTITRHLQAQGVDTSHVVWTAADRVGLYLLEEAPPPRGSQVLYDRAGSAMSRMQPDDLPADVFAPGAARLLHLTGITPALSPSAAATAAHALALAQAAGWPVSFDLNYRARLWTPEAAREGCHPFAAAATILFAPRGDMALYGLSSEATPEQALAVLAAEYPQATLVLTLGAQGAIGCTPGGPPLWQPAFPAGDVGRLGRGDSFVAGFLSAYLRSDDAGQRLAHALAWGAATAAIKSTIPGDAPLIERAEVQALLAGSSAAGLRR